MKLTKYISLRYIGVSILIITLSIPILFFILRQVLYNSIDETMHNKKKWVIEKLRGYSSEHIMNMNKDIFIIPTNDSISPDNIFTKDIFVEEENEVIRHRILEFYAIINGQVYKIHIRKSLIETEEILKTVIILQLSVLLLLIISLFIIDRYVNLKIWKPFYHILDKLRTYRVDKQEELDFLPTEISEFNDLKTSIKELSRRNHELYISQKEFTENASHELQTPLAIFQTNLENLWQTEPISNEQAQLMNKMQESTARMSRLNRALLLLSKIENDQFLNKEHIPFANFVKKIAMQYKEFMLNKKINLVFDKKEDFEIYADRSLIEILINNLITNAVRYSSHNGSVEINIKNYILQISNAAQNGELDNHKLFKRFQKQNPSIQSTGLGLEICKKICDLYGYRISYRFENNYHIFYIEFHAK